MLNDAYKNAATDPETYGRQARFIMPIIDAEGAGFRPSKREAELLLQTLEELLPEEDQTEKAVRLIQYGFTQGSRTAENVARGELEEVREALIWNGYDPEGKDIL